MHHAPGSFGVIIAENALHHASDLKETVRQLSNILQPGGHLILRDFVGPSRFQWSDEQIKHCDALLNRLPESYRLRWRCKTVKKRFHRTGVLSMMLGDPSEAVHSADILDVLGEHFTCKELRPLGGTLLQLVFDDIAQHFQDQTPEIDRILEMCIAQEKDLISTGVLPSDFVYGVFQLMVTA